MRIDSPIPRPSALRGLQRSAKAPRAQGGFSLVEMLIVLVLLIIMTSMYWSSSSASRQHQLQKDCQKNLLKVYLAMDTFANEHGGTYPYLATAQNSEDVLDVLVPRYTSDTSVFICPGSKTSPLEPGQSLRQGKISYAFYMGRTSKDTQAALLSDRQVDTQSKAVGQLLFSSNGKPPGNNHYKYGGNVLFVDGHVDLSPAHAAMPLGLPQGVVLLNPK